MGRKLFNRRGRAGALRAERTTVGLAVVALEFPRRPADGGGAPDGEASPRERRGGDARELRRRCGAGDPGHDRGRPARPPRHPDTRPCSSTPGFPRCLATTAALDLGMRRGWWPFHEVTVGGRHIHHFVPGIVLAFASAIAGMTTRDNGVEAAALVLRGWGGADPGRGGAPARPPRRLLDAEGVLGVQVSLGVTATLAASILALESSAGARRGGGGRSPPRARDRQHRRARVAAGGSYVPAARIRRRRRYAMDARGAPGRDRRAGRVRRSQ